MAGPRCKALLNGLVQGLTKSLETILISDQLMAGVSEATKNDWLQRLANCDLAVMHGDGNLLPKGGLAQIVAEMEVAGLVTDELWYVLRKPGDPSSAGFQAAQNPDGSFGLELRQYGQGIGAVEKKPDTGE